MNSHMRIKCAENCIARQDPLDCNALAGVLLDRPDTDTYELPGCPNHFLRGLRERRPQVAAAVLLAVQHSEAAAGTTPQGGVA